MSSLLCSRTQEGSGGLNSLLEPSGRDPRQSGGRVTASPQELLRQVYAREREVNIYVLHRYRHVSYVLELYGGRFSVSLKVLSEIILC